MQITDPNANASTISIPYYLEDLTSHIFISTDQKLLEKCKSPSPSEEALNQQIMDRAVLQFREWNNDSAYQKRFFVVRNSQKLENLKKTVSYKMYQEFIQLLITKIYAPIYGAINENFEQMEPNKIEKEIKEKYPEFWHDFWSEQSVIMAVSLTELIDKVTDGEIHSSFCLLSLAYRFRLNLKLSPLALSISFFNYKQLQIEKPSSKERIYSKSTLPRLTYICFSGFYSELDIDIINEFSENVQIIMIYDASTGGPLIGEERIVDADDDDARLPNQRRHFLSISEKLLLLPLDCSDGKITSRNLHDLFDTMVTRSIKKFRAEMVLINHPFNFDSAQTSTSQLPFMLKPKTWSKILYDICLTVNCKVMIHPHKIIDPKNYDSGVNFKGNNAHLNFFVTNVVPVYANPFRRGYFEKCFLLSLEVLARMKNYAKKRKKELHPREFNRRLERSISVLMKYYQEHPFYSNLYLDAGMTVDIREKAHENYTKEVYAMAKANPSVQLTDNQLMETEETENTYSRHKLQMMSNEVKKLHAQYKSNRIVLFKTGRLSQNIVDVNNKDYLGEYNLVFDDGVPFIPLKVSQYIVDYENNRVYYFNGTYKGEIRHYEFVINESESDLKGSVSVALNTNFPWDSQTKGPLIDAGLCLGNGRIYWVYGKHLNGSTWKNSDEIYYFDQRVQKWTKPTIQGRGDKFVSRHSVTCTYFCDSKTGQEYLLVFGGDSDEPTKAHLEIYNIVEIYRMDFETGIFEYTAIQKSALFSDKVSYIPHIYSFAFQINQNSNNVLILGGKKHPFSVFESRTTKLFNYNFTFEKFLPILPDIIEKREVPSRKRDVTEKVVLSDPSRNMCRVNNQIYILAQNGNSDYCIAQVSQISGNFEKGPSIITLAHRIEGPALIPTPRADKTNQFLFHSDEASRSGNAPLSASQELINILRKEKPETLLLLEYFARYLENAWEKGESLNQTFFLGIAADVFRDPMFLTENSKELAVAANSICKIVDFLASDKRISSSIAKMHENIPNGRLSELETSEKKNEISKNLLQNKSRKPFIQALNSEISHAVETEALKMELLYKLDRVFQRTTNLQKYHEPLFGEKAHRWMTYNLNELIKKPEGEFKSFAKGEDTGILRDLVACFGLLWKKTQSGFEGFSLELNIDDLQKDQDVFWTDRQIDKLMGSQSEETAQLIIIERSDDIRSLLIVLLMELRERENQLNSSFNDESEKKWVQLTKKFGDQSPILNITVTMDPIRDRSSMVEEDKEENVDMILEESSYRKLEVTGTRLVDEMDRLHMDSSKIEEEKSEEPQRAGLLSPSGEKDESYLAKDKDKIIDEGEEKKPTTKLGIKHQKEEKMQEETKVSEIVGASPRVREPITYHSADNVLDAHDSEELNQFKWYLSLSSNEILAVTNDKTLRATLAVYDKETNQLDLIYLDVASEASITIWNAAIYLYLDRNLADRPSPVCKKFKDCILYADLRESFKPEGKTRGLIAFVPLLKNEDVLLNRAIIADDQGIYLIGGSRIGTAKKNPITYSSQCSFYSIEDLQEISTRPGKTDLNPAMTLKRDNLIVAQNKARLFVASRTSWNPERANLTDKLTVEVYNKDDEVWSCQFDIPLDEVGLSFNMLIMKGREDKKEKLVVIGSRRGRPAIGYAINVDDIIKLEEDDLDINSILQTTSKITDSSGGALVLTGFELFPIQSTNEQVESLSIRNHKKEPPETEEYYCF